VKCDKATEVKNLVTGMCVGYGVLEFLSIEHEVNVTKKNYLLQSATPDKQLQGM
jgi:hypothetical protein